MKPRQQITVFDLWVLPDTFEQAWQAFFGSN